MKKKPFLKLRFVLWTITLIFLLTGLFTDNTQASRIGYISLIIYSTFNLVINTKNKVK